MTDGSRRHFHIGGDKVSFLIQRKRCVLTIIIQVLWVV